MSGASKRASEAVWRLLFGGAKDKPVVESPTKAQATELIAAEYAPLLKKCREIADSGYLNLKLTRELNELLAHIEGDTTP